jgi:tetratricopeptide (TPR) repeat protein
MRLAWLSVTCMGLLINGALIRTVCAAQDKKNESNSKPSGNPLVPIPFSVLEGLKRSKAELFTRGSQRLQAGRLTEAAEDFREMVALDPRDPTARMYLGITLARAGDQKAALEQDSEALRLAPNNASVHLNLGVVLTALGSEAEAIEHFQAAVQSDPQLTQAHFQLANLLMRKGRYREAAPEYAAVIGMEPRNGFARLMEAMALIRVKAYAQARAKLEQGLLVLPQDADLAMTLARLLAACPDASVRDGPRALQLIQQLMTSQQSFDLEQGQTMAMALAASDHFQEAAQIQGYMVTELENAQRFDLARLLRANLTLYEHHQPCLTPWTDDDPVFSPVASHAAESAEVPPASEKPAAPKQ